MRIKNLGPFSLESSSRAQVALWWFNYAYTCLLREVETEEGAVPFRKRKRLIKRKFSSVPLFLAASQRALLEKCSTVHVMLMAASFICSLFSATARVRPMMWSSLANETQTGKLEVYFVDCYVFQWVDSLHNGKVKSFAPVRKTNFLSTVQIMCGINTMDVQSDYCHSNRKGKRWKNNRKKESLAVE